MRVLNLSLDRSAISSESPTAKRIAALSNAAGEVTVLVPEAGNKLIALFGVWRKANRLHTLHFTTKGPDTKFLILDSSTIPSREVASP